MISELEQFIELLGNSPDSDDALVHIAAFIRTCDDRTFSTWISQSFSAYLQLQQWIWQSLTEPRPTPSYFELLSVCAKVNKEYILDRDTIDTQRKALLLFPSSIAQIDPIFNRIHQAEDDNDPLVAICALFIDNCAHLLREHVQDQDLSSIIDHLHGKTLSTFIMTDRYKTYLDQLRQPHPSPSIFADRFLFYIKTCSHYAYAYLNHRAACSPDLAQQVILSFGDDYLTLINIHSHTVASWSRELLTCLTRFLTLIIGYLSHYDQLTLPLTRLFKNETIACDHVEDLVRILAHPPLRQAIGPPRSNDETILVFSILLAIIVTAKSHRIYWFVRSKEFIRDTLMSIAELSSNEIIALRAYAILTRVLTDEQLKELQIGDGVVRFFFHILKEGWIHPSKEFQRTPISLILEGLGDLFKSDSMQQKTANLEVVPLLIELSDSYPIVFDIIWTLSFNKDIQRQLHGHSAFLNELSRLAHYGNDQTIRKVASGILWNLHAHHDGHSSETDGSTEKYDLMISYSHKDKQLCKQVYDELVKRGYRVWIDFDQMHGNVMDAMAQAIEQSHMIIICMSEDYRRSNFCRAEAHYAFQRQLKIAPILLQKHYKPDGWLLFLIGQLLYVDFTKHEFTKAMSMLLKEIHAHRPAAAASTPPIVTNPPSSVTSSETKQFLEWSSDEVEEWLMKHGLKQMSRLLQGCDGRSVLYFFRFVRSGPRSEMISLLNSDAQRRLNEPLSVIELCQLLSLIDRNLP